MTEFYCFSHPITSVQPEKVGAHIHLRVFVRGALTGTLIQREEEVPGLLAVLHERQPAVVRTAGRSGPELSWHGSFADDVYLVSEFGEVVQVKDLR